MMKYQDIQEVAVIYGKKELIEEFLEIFNIGRQHDNALLKAIQLKGETKKDLKKLIWKGD